MSKHKLILNQVIERLHNEPECQLYRAKLEKRKCTNTLNVVIEKYYENGANFIVFNKPISEVEELLKQYN